MNPRLAKQILYGTGYILVFFLIILGIYFLWLKPKPTSPCGPVPCELKNLAPIQVSWIRYFPGELNSIIVAEIQNPNINYGADNFSYSLSVYDRGGNPIKNIIKQSFIYAGEIKYIIELTDVDYKNISSANLTFSGIDWKSKPDFPAPVVQTRDIKTEPTGPQNKNVDISGFVFNNNPYPLSKTHIIGFLFNQNGSQISASLTEIDNVDSFSERRFKINFPTSISPIAPSSSSQIFNFTRDLGIGSKGNDVLTLQTFLKNQGLLNREPSDYFGSITKNALIKYQKAAGITPATGYLGKNSRNYINALLAKAAQNSVSTLTQADPSQTKIYVEAIR